MVTVFVIFCTILLRVTVLDLFGLTGDEKLPFGFRILPNGIFLPMGGKMGARKIPP
jgi:hypothetical protein